MAKKEQTEKTYTLKELAEKHLKTPFKNQTYMLEGIKAMFNLKDDAKLTEEEFLKMLKNFKGKKTEG
ncbi:MAG: hypothetical protein GXO21_05905 [Aquificae bacterium]|nr:hypothetical protein [Aquificota bacterium]